MIDILSFLYNGHGVVWGYSFVFLLSFGESLVLIGLIIPGSVAVIIAGFLVSQGFLDVGDLFVWASLGAILGDSLSFSLGKRGFISFNESNLLFKPVVLEKGKRYFQKYGAKSVFFGRFIGWVRPIIPFIAGVFDLNRRTFLVWNIASGILWAISHIALGYFFGQAWQLAATWSTRISLFVLLLGVLLMVLYVVRRAAGHTLFPSA